MTLQEQFEALEKAARYIHLYELHSPKLVLHSPNIYQFFANELMKAIEQTDATPMMMALGATYPCVRELAETVAIKQLLEESREQNCPELNALMQSLAIG